MTEAPVRPDSKILKALTGRTEKVTTLSHKQGPENGHLVTVRLVREGAGMLGLEDMKDNQEWSGIFNHLVKATRVAVFLADAKKRKGGKVNPQLVLNAGLADHISRRQYDEAKLYEEAVPLAKKKVKAGTTVPGIALLKKAGISDEIISVVEAHDAPSYPLERVDTWEKKIAIYADYRTGQNVVSLEARLEDLKRLISDGRWTQEQYDECKNWIIGIEKEIFSNLDIKPGDITDSFPPQPRWERYLRRLYIEDAESGIFARLSLLYKELAEGKIDKAKLEEEFPDNTWWGRYARELYEKQKGIPYEPTHVKAHGVPHGINRAIRFYRGLDDK